ncbi:MAG: hypothetical protein ACIAXF_14450 [Phycisphaerales bacterium JB063]
MAQMNDTWRIWTDRKAYETFFDHDWARRVGRRVQKTPFDDMVFKLCFQWKGAANTSALPFILVDMCSSFSDGYINGQRPRPLILLDAIAGRLGDKMSLPQDSDVRVKMLEGISEIDLELTQKLAMNPYSMDKEELWDGLVVNSELAMAILMSQRMCYSNLFFGYEDFVVRVVKLVSGIDGVRSGRNFDRHLEDTFGKHWKHDLWQSEHIRVPRLVRHALVHAGGSETAELQKVKHGFEVIGGRLQITVLDTRELFARLSTTVEKLIDHLV